MLSLAEAESPLRGFRTRSCLKSICASCFRSLCALQLIARVLGSSRARQLIYRHALKNAVHEAQIDLQVLLAFEIRTHQESEVLQGFQAIDAHVYKLLLL